MIQDSQGKREPEEICSGSQVLSEEDDRMIFRYEDYFRACCTGILFESAFLGMMVLGSFVGLYQKATKKPFSWSSIMVNIIAAVIFVYMLSMCLGILMHGGIYLLREKEDAKIDISGTIEDCQEMTQFMTPGIGTHYHEYGDGCMYGYVITVEGEALKIPSMGDLTVGDNVFVSYLPKSKYVLSIEKKE